MEQMIISPEGMIEIEENIKKHNMLLNGHMKGVITESCALGYYLRKAQDSGLIAEKGYSGIGEYAKAIAGISPSRATNLIKINKIISVGGYSEQVSEEYMEYSESQMQEISNLDEDDRAIIIPQMTVREIHAIKKLEMAETEQKKAEEENNLPIVQMAAEPEKKSVNPIEAPKDAEVTPDEIQERWKKVITQFFREKDSTLLSKVQNRLITYDDFIVMIKNRTYFMSELNDFLIFDEKKITHRSYCGGKKCFTEHSPEELFATAQEIIFEEPVKEEKPLATPQSELEQQKKEWQKPEISECKKEDATADVHLETETDTEVPDTEPYKPLPGQITTQDIPELVSDASAAGSDENIIDGTCRDLEVDTEECPYRICHMQEAAEWYEKEIDRIDGLPREFRKQRQLEIGLWAIRKYLNMHNRQEG